MSSVPTSGQGMLAMRTHGGAVGRECARAPGARALSERGRGGARPKGKKLSRRGHSGATLCTPHTATARPTPLGHPTPHASHGDQQEVVRLRRGCARRRLGGDRRRRCRLQARIRDVRCARDASAAPLMGCARGAAPPSCARRAIATRTRALAPARARARVRRGVCASSDSALTWMLRDAPHFARAPHARPPQ